MCPNAHAASNVETLGNFFFFSESQFDDKLMIITTSVQSSLKFQDGICKALSIIFCTVDTDRLSYYLNISQEIVNSTDN